MYETFINASWPSRASGITSAVAAAVEASEYSQVVDEWDIDIEVDEDDEEDVDPDKGDPTEAEDSFLLDDQHWHEYDG